MFKHYWLYTFRFILSCIVANHVFGCAATGKSVSGFPDATHPNKQNGKNIDEGKITRFDKAVMQEKPVFISSALSPDGRTISLLFDYFGVDLQKYSGKDVLSATKVSSFIIPIKDADTELTIQQDIRGYVFADKGARAILLAQICGKTTVYNWPNSRQSDDHFIETCEVSLPKGKNYQATLILLVERDSDDSNVLFHIDSIDMRIVKSN